MAWASFLVVLTALFLNSEAALKDGDCEVCIKVVSRIAKSLQENKIEGDANIQAHIKEICGAIKERKENRFCYYIGGTEDAATGILKKVSEPLANFLPAERICEKLKKVDSQICELKYDKPIDWKNINLKKMKVKQLKKILDDWGDGCKGCIEKSDFIKRIEELKPLHVRDEL